MYFSQEENKRESWQWKEFLRYFFQHSLILHMMPWYQFSKICFFMSNPKSITASAFYQVTFNVRGRVVAAVASDFSTLWTVACQVPLSIEFSRPRILEWVAMPSSRGSSRLRDWTRVSWGSWTASGFFTAEPPGKPITLSITQQFLSDNNFHILSHILKPYYSDIIFLAPQDNLFSRNPLSYSSQGFIQKEANSIYVTRKSLVLTINLLIGDLMQFHCGARFK